MAFIGEEVVVEICTNLLDKNGKEIYEGDIIQETGQQYPSPYGHCPDADPTEHEHRYVVSYDDQCGKFNIVRHIPGVQGFRYVVIGNIHENPDLLK